jgi:hypothetical protein
VRIPRWIEDAVAWLRWDLPPKLGGVGRWGVLVAGAAVAIAALVWAAVSGPLSDDAEPGETRVVTVPVATDDVEEAPVGELGFPLVATRNTTRVGGADPAADAAAVALATHPPAPGADPIEAAVVVGEDDWQAGIAASVLAGPPLRAPLLIGGADGLPDASEDALATLQPRGGSGPDDAAVYTVGEVPPVTGLATEDLQGDSPAALAASIDGLRGRLLKRRPRHLVVASQDDAAFAMPAAGWAARSGDPVLFSGRDRVPIETLAALRRHRGVPVYVLGGESVISDAALRQLRRVTPVVRRVGADDPVASAIEFARFADESFGWNINDPGHGLVLASSSRPLDAAAAAALSASGTWGAMVITDRADSLPPELRSFLLDIKPGFEDDPTRAVYNHVWLIGDTTAIGAAVQAQIDELAELTEIGPGTGGPVTEAPGGSAFATPGRAEDEPRSKPGAGAP